MVPIFTMKDYDLLPWKCFNILTTDKSITYNKNHAKNVCFPHVCCVKMKCTPHKFRVIDTTLCYQVSQWFSAGRLFTPGPSVSSTNKTDLHDITEILLKVALNTITLTLLHVHVTFLNKGYLVGSQTLSMNVWSIWKCNIVDCVNFAFWLAEISNIFLIRTLCERSLLTYSPLKPLNHLKQIWVNVS